MRHSRQVVAAFSCDHMEGNGRVDQVATDMRTSCIWCFEGANGAFTVTLDFSYLAESANRDWVSREYPFPYLTRYNDHRLSD